MRRVSEFLSLDGARRLPASFEVRVVTVAAGGERPFDEAEWHDALVVVERGEIELECLGGSRHRFRRGDVLWLMGLPLRVLRNRGLVPVVLTAVSRRSDEFAAGGPSYGLKTSRSTKGER